MTKELQSDNKEKHPSVEHTQMNITTRVSNNVWLS